MKKSVKMIVTLVVVLLVIVAAIKFVEPVNDWARLNLPEAFMSLIGEDLTLIDKGRRMLN